MGTEVTWSPVLVTRWMIAVIIALWSLLIGPEIPGDWDHGHVGPQGAPQGNVQGSGKQIPMKQMALRPAADVDREAFLASYRRQARALLNPCLQTWQPSPGMATFSAVLHKKTGRISNLEAINVQEVLPDCVGKITASMNFSAVAESMTGEQVVLQWATEW